jgi:hypothetical protein
MIQEEEWVHNHLMGSLAKKKGPIINLYPCINYSLVKLKKEKQTFNKVLLLHHSCTCPLKYLEYKIQRTIINIKVQIVIKEKKLEKK